jgi:hypothetical protein
MLRKISDMKNYDENKKNPFEVEPENIKKSMKIV